MAEFVTGPPVGERRTVAVAGEFDIAGVEDFLVAAFDCPASGARLLEIDLGQISFIDSSGLGALVRVRNAARDRGKEITLTHVPDAVDRLLVVTGLADLFGTRTDV
jgi:anti-anti-sigma factor